MGRASIGHGQWQIPQAATTLPTTNGLVHRFGRLIAYVTLIVACWAMFHDSVTQRVVAQCEGEDPALGVDTRGTHSGPPGGEIPGLQKATRIAVGSTAGAVVSFTIFLIFLIFLMMIRIGILR